MARRLVFAVLLGLAGVVFVVARDADRHDARFTIVSGPPDPVAAFELPRTPIRFDVRPTSVRGRGQVLTQVGTYLLPPTNTLTVTVLGPNDTRLARCVSPPTSYRDNSQLSCPVPDLSQVRALRVERRGGAKIAMITHDHTAGYLLADEQTSLTGRISTVLSRIATPLPNGIGSTIALGGLFASVAMTLFVLLLSIRFIRREPGTEDSSPWFSTDQDQHPPQAAHHQDPHSGDHQSASGHHSHPGADTHEHGGFEHGSGGGHHSNLSDSSSSGGDPGGGDAGSGGDSGGSGGD